MCPNRGRNGAHIRANVVDTAPAVGKTGTPESTNQCDSFWYLNWFNVFNMQAIKTLQLKAELEASRLDKNEAVLTLQG